MPRITPVHYKRLVCVFEKDGFVSRRTSGDHIIMTKPGTVRPLVIQKKDQVPIYHIIGLLRTAGMSRDPYFQLLDEC